MLVFFQELMLHCCCILFCALRTAHCALRTSHCAPSNKPFHVLCLHAVHISRMYVVIHFSHGAARRFRVIDSAFHSLGTPRRPRTNGTTRSTRTAWSPGSPRWTASMSPCLRQNMHQGLSTTLLRGQKEEISPPAIKSATLTTTVPFLYSYSKQ